MCVPTDKADNVIDADAPVRFTVPSVVAPSMKVKYPVGVPAPVATDTVAVKVVGAPYVVVGTLDTNTEVVAPCCTTCDTVFEAEVLKWISPLYVACKEFTPTPKDEIESTATPLTTLLVPIIVGPSLNVTVPVGDPAPGEVTDIVAVNRVVLPTIVGFTDDVNATLVEARLTTSVTVFDVDVKKFPSPL